MNKEEMTQEILGCFDFQQVQKVMELVGWSYKLEASPPELSEIVGVARRHLVEVLRRDCSCSVESGGFRVILTKGAEDGDRLELEFVLQGEERCSGWECS